MSKEIIIDTSDEGVLKRFMLEFFDFKSLCKAGFFKKEWKHDYKKQAERLCEFFGFETIYEYGAIEIRGYISFDDPTDKPFITELKNIYLD